MHTATMRLAPEELELLLAVTSALAAPHELHDMLAAVNDAAMRVLRSDRSSVWLHDAATGELVLEVARDLAAVRLAPGTGLVGACALGRSVLNVPDCYADPRFDRTLDSTTGYRTRSSLTLPLLLHEGTLVGVLQVLNRKDGLPFDAADERLALALAAQCAVALARARETEALLESRRLRAAMDTARTVQQASLPAVLPTVPGYDLHAAFLPAEQTGGDTYDLAMVGRELLVVLADATGHGIAAALSVMQMQAMLRTALGCGVGLEAAFRQVNDQLAATLPDGRFVTAFVGLLDPHTHRLRFLSGGQGPILHWRAAAGRFDVHKATSFPLGAMPMGRLRPPVELVLEPGDMLVLLSDGVFEREDAEGRCFGRERVEAVAARKHASGARGVMDVLLRDLETFAGGVSQQDDITAVLVRRAMDVGPT